MPLPERKEMFSAIDDAIRDFQKRGIIEINGGMVRVRRAPDPICAALALEQTYAQDEATRLTQKAAWMRAQGGALTPEQTREDDAARKRNEELRVEMASAVLGSAAKGGAS